MKRIHADTDLTVTFNFTEFNISDVNNVYFVLLNSVGGVAKQVAIEAVEGFPNDDVTVVNDNEVDILIHRAENVDWPYGKYTFQVRVAYLNVDFENAEEIRSDAYPTFRIVADYEKTKEGEGVDLEFPIGGTEGAQQTNELVVSEPSTESLAGTSLAQDILNIENKGYAREMSIHTELEYVSGALFKMSSKLTTLEDGREIKFKLPSSYPIEDEVLQISIDDGVTYREARYDDGDPINMNTQIIVGEYHTFNFDSATNKWVFTHNEGVLSLLTGLNWAGQNIMMNYNTNVVQQEAIDNIIEAISQGGQIVTRNITTSTPVILTALPQKITFETTEKESNDTDIIDGDVNNDHILNSDNDAGFNVFGRFSFSNASNALDHLITARLHADEVLIDEFSLLILKKQQIVATKSYNFIDTAPPSTLTVEIEGNTDITMLDGQLNASSNFTIGGGAIPVSDITPLSHIFNDATDDSDPTTGAFKLSAGNDFIYVSDTSSNAAQIGLNYWNKIKEGAAIYIQKVADASEYKSIVVTGDAIVATNYTKIPVTVIDTGLGFNVGEKYTFTLMNTGGGGVTLPTFSNVSITANGQVTNIDMSLNETLYINIGNGVTDHELTFSNLDDTNDQERKVRINNSSNLSDIEVLTLTGNWIDGGDILLDEVPASKTVRMGVENDKDNGLIYYFS